MSIDCRTRLHRDRQPLSRDEVFDRLLPDAIERNADLAARGLLYKELPSLSLCVEGRTLTLKEEGRRLTLQEGACDDGAVAALGEDALSDLVQDWKTTMGLAMNSQVTMVQGEFSAWVGWEVTNRTGHVESVSARSNAVSRGSMSVRFWWMYTDRRSS